MWQTVYIFIIVYISTSIFKRLLCIRYSKIQYYLKFFTFYFGLVLISMIVLPYSILKPKDLHNFKVYARLTKYLMKCLNLKLQIRNKKNLYTDKGAVIIVNHRSVLDSLVVCRMIDEVDKEFTAIAKKEVSYLGPFGLCAYLSGVIFVDRKNTKNAHESLRITNDLILKRKAHIIFFPEGTRNNEYTKLLPFKRGAFKIAVEAQVPIIPVVFSPYYFMNNEKHIFDKGSVILQCLEPVPTAGLTSDDIPHLITQCHNTMTEACEKLYQEVNNGLETS